MSLNVGGLIKKVQYTTLSVGWWSDDQIKKIKLYVNIKSVKM